MTDGHISSAAFTEATRFLLEHLVLYDDQPSQSWSLSMWDQSSECPELVCQKVFHDEEQFSSLDAYSVQQSHQQTVCLEYRIAYNSSYEVPVLYMKGQYTDGSPVSADKFWDFISRCPTTPQLNDLIPGMTQVEHPHLGIPYYLFHPCKTAQLMHTVLVSDDVCAEPLPHAARYLVLWLSLLASPFGLNLPLGMFQRDQISR